MTHLNEYGSMLLSGAAICLLSVFFLACIVLGFNRARNLTWLCFRFLFKHLAILLGRLLKKIGTVLLKLVIYLAKVLYKIFMSLRVRK